MPFFKQEVVPESIPAEESQTSKHSKPTVVTVPPRASAVVNRMSVAKSTGTTPVGDGLVSTSSAVAKGVTEFTNTATEAAGKVQSGIATAQSAAQDPAGFAISQIQSISGVSIPSSPQGVANLLAKFSKPKPTGDGRTNIAEEKTEGEDIASKIGDVGSLIAKGPQALTSKINSTIGQIVPSEVTEAAGSVTELASLGGVPVDNVISTSVNKVTSPVQSSLTKVNNAVDGTQGIIT